ncbi:high mobility group protein [Anaeramoeba flamelloides]|uniref:High mobility group protein n=1 Tax=Anaeramoeba flamelloides TaxID=1746091 RepID=A0AAV7YY33_9EUKA|nr:high mobility group protein [Anaeramoeba flamelloides]
MQVEDLSRKRKSSQEKPEPSKSVREIFFEKESENLLEEDPDLKQRQLEKLVGDKWNGLPIEEKKKYFEIVKKDKERYEKELDEYYEAKKENQLSSESGSGSESGSDKGSNSDSESDSD